ncbi:MAG: undecaprenyl-diphosphate phosphatase [Pseudomonadota bacterium]
MPILQLVIIAIVQGITEFLPISSSAHLILAPLAVESWADQGPLIDIAAHVGSLGAVLLYFRNETAMLFRGGVDTVRFQDSADRRLFLVVAAATIPIIVAAAVFVLLDLTEALRSPVVIGWASIIFAILLWAGDRAPEVREGLDRITWREVMTIGLAQACALVPGASRSGVTMTAARYLGWTRTEAARFSMLLAIPTIMAFGLFAGLELASNGETGNMVAALIVAALSFTAAYGAIMVFMRLTQSMTFTPFVIYRILMGVALIWIFQAPSAT